MLEIKRPSWSGALSILEQEIMDKDWIVGTAKVTDMPVQIASGALIGTVKTVDIAPDGSAARVLVGLYAGGSVWIVADALRYNRNARVLLTNLKNTDLSAHRQSF